jgi:hypothetical protein
LCIQIEEVENNISGSSKRDHLASVFGKKVTTVLGPFHLQRVGMGFLFGLEIYASNQA